MRKKSSGYKSITTEQTATREVKTEITVHKLTDGTISIEFESSNGPDEVIRIQDGRISIDKRMAKQYGYEVDAE